MRTPVDGLEFSRPPPFREDVLEELEPMAGETP